MVEAAGYDVVIVETVGVGQSEIAVAAMTDMFVLLQLPNAGDDLQAIKMGVTELADLIVVNKADLDEAAATRARAQITSSLRLLGLHGRSEDAPEDGARVASAGAAAERAHRAGPGRVPGRGGPVPGDAGGQRPAGVAAAGSQAESWMKERVEAGLRERFRAHPAVRAALPAAIEDVRAGRVAASVAARQLLDLLG